MTDEQTIDPAAEREAALAALQARIAGIQDGIYFGLPADVYHGVPRLSASGIQKLCVSPGTFWKGSWLDPERPELDDDSTKAQTLGKAYHCARLEPHLFDQLFVRELDRADFPTNGAVYTGTQIGAALADMGHAKSKAGEKVMDQAMRLMAAGYEGTIWPIEEAKWEEARNGRTPIPAKYWDDITTDMERLRGSRDIAKLLEGGAAEVSVFWTDKHGLQMKARVDYLRPDLWSDFKTMDNSRGKRLDQAIADAVRFNRYYVQAVVYRDAVEAIRTGGLQVIDEATDEERKLIASIQISPAELACWYIFQEKNGIPNLLARRFEFFALPIGREQEADAVAVDAEHAASSKALQMRKTGIHMLGNMEVEKAKRDFALYSQVYKPGTPWFPIEPLGTIGDLDFNSYWLEGKA